MLDLLLFTYYIRIIVSYNFNYSGDRNTKRLYY